MLSPVWCGRTSLACKDLNPIQHLRDELKCRVRPYQPTSVLDLTSALAAECEQIPAARFQDLMERVSKTVEEVIAADYWLWFFGGNVQQLYMVGKFKSPKTGQDRQTDS